MAEDDRARWDRRWAEQTHEHTTPPDWIGELESEFPKERRALDVACGAGRAALWLARRGFRVTAVDISPVGLARVEEVACAEGLRVETQALDLEREPLPEGPWDLISCIAYLQRDLFPAFRDRLAPNGLLVCGNATLRNLERHDRPPARFLLGENELLRLCAPLRIVYYREGWVGDHAVARVVARKPADL